MSIVLRAFLFTITGDFQTKQQLTSSVKSSACALDLYCWQNQRYFLARFIQLVVSLHPGEVLRLATHLNRSVVYELFNARLLENCYPSPAS